MRIGTGPWIVVPVSGLLVGRSGSCDLRLEETDASRRHLMFSFLAGMPWAIDQGSTNGTLLDGLPLARKRLNDRHTFLIGSQELHWKRGEGLSAPPELWEQWMEWRVHADRGRWDSAAAEALRLLGAASSCRLSSKGAAALSWDDGAGAEGLGPMRRHLFEAALHEVPGSR